MIDVPNLPPAQSLRPTLRIALLGPPTLTWGDRSFVIARRQARALLYRIAAAPQPVPRDQLGHLFWPTSTESTGRRNLTVLLTQIRRALPQPDLLVAADDAIGLDHTSAETDTLAFATLIPQATGARRLDLLADAVRQYRGPFLDGFALPDSAEFDIWASQERQVWERRYLDALTVLVEEYAAAGDYHAAIDAAQQALATDELAEDMHCRLIALYAVVGDRTAAMRQFERCVVVLERELGVDPLPETRAAYEAARDGRYEDKQARRQGDKELRKQQFTPSPFHPITPASPLPAPLHLLIGRAAELQQVYTLLADSETRLVTLYGPGGSGKTRLAQQIAWDMQASFADGAVFVALAPLRDPALVLEAIAQACGLHEVDKMSLGEQLRDKQLLLVLDNCEHLPAAAPVIADLIAAAPTICVLATSRSVLRIQGEHTLAVMPLPLPDLTQLPPLDVLAEQPSVALLLARVRAHNPRFVLTKEHATDLAAICVRLDGLPLAIELAAAHLKLLAPHALLKRLDRRLALLTHGPRDLPDRQQTLRTTIDWSYRLLDPSERALFEQLAVFAGSWTLEAAETVCGIADCRSQIADDESQSIIYNLQSTILDGLAALLDKSLIQPIAGPDGEPRFQMLETIREYALERLRARGDERAAHHRHAIYFCQFAERRAPGFHSAEIATADRDYHNIRAALHWAIQTGEYLVAARIAGAIFWYWDTRGFIEEGQSWIAQLLRHAATLPDLWRARMYAYAAYLAYRRGAAVEATNLAARVIDDDQAAADDRALSMRVAGLSALEAGDQAAARRHFERALAFAQKHHLPAAIAAAQFNLGLLSLIQGQLDQAEVLLWESYEPWERQQHPRYAGVALVTLGYIAVLRGDAQPAGALLRDGLRQLRRAQETTYLLYGLLACAGFATMLRRPFEAAALFGAGLEHAGNVRLTFIRSVLALARAHMERTRGAGDAAAFEQALQHGRSLTLDAAVALAHTLFEAGDDQHALVLGERWALAS
jgi:predicted ATPase/DNA-binding SARP family transcriptional activator